MSHFTDTFSVGFYCRPSRKSPKGGIACPFAGHVEISITGKYYADIRIVFPSSRAFVIDSLRSFLG